MRWLYIYTSYVPEQYSKENSYPQKFGLLAEKD